MSFDLSKPFSHTMEAGMPAFDMINMPEMRNALFKNKDITLDGWKFVGCKLHGCRVHVSSMFFVIDSCEFDSDCVVYFQGETIKLIQLWNYRNEWIKSSYPTLAPKFNVDGTMSIGA